MNIKWIRQSSCLCSREYAYYSHVDFTSYVVKRDRVAGGWVLLVDGKRFQSDGVRVLFQTMRDAKMQADRLVEHSAEAARSGVV